MVIEKVFGISQTTISLSERFRMLGPMRRPTRPTRVLRRRRSDNVMLIDALIKRAEMRSRRGLRSRIGVFRGRGGDRGGARGRGGGAGGGYGALRRWGSEGSVFIQEPARQSYSAVGFQRSRNNSFNNLTRSGSFGNLSQVALGNRGRSGSYGNLSQGSMGSRGRGRGGFVRGQRGALRQLAYQQGVFLRPMNRSAFPAPLVNGVQRGRGGAVRGRGGARGRGRGRGRGLVRGTGAMRMRGLLCGAGAMHGPLPPLRRIQNQKPVPSKEELDVQLDQYMAGSKSALDRELEDYMKDAMDTL